MNNAPPSFQFEEWPFAVNGIELNVVSRRPGGRVPVIFLHGFPCHSTTWRALLECLPGTFSCHAPDLLGFNRSSRPQDPDRYQIDKGVADIVGLVEHLTRGRGALIVGQDIGGLLGYVLTARRPDLVRALVVVNAVHPAAFRRALLLDRAQIMASAYLDLLSLPNAADIITARGFEPLLRSYRTMLNTHAPAAGEDSDLVRVWSGRGTLRAMLNWYRANTFYRTDPEAVLPQSAANELAEPDLIITRPHLAIWGTPDRYLHLVNRRLAAPYCPAMETLELAGAGHLPHVTEPRAVAKAITDFAAKVLRSD